MGAGKIFQNIELSKRHIKGIYIIDSSTAGGNIDIVEGSASLGPGV